MHSTLKRFVSHKWLRNLAIFIAVLSASWLVLAARSGAFMARTDAALTSRASTASHRTLEELQSAGGIHGHQLPSVSEPWFLDPTDPTKGASRPTKGLRDSETGGFGLLQKHPPSGDRKARMHPQSHDPTATRPLLSSSEASAEARAEMAAFNPSIVREVQSAVAAHPVVVIGMAQNPHVKRVRKALEGAGIDFTYVEYGSYFSKWGERLAIKLWSGWPTFPQVFARGVLLGGEDLTLLAIENGSLRRMLDAKV